MSKVTVNAEKMAALFDDLFVIEEGEKPKKKLPARTIQTVDDVDLHNLKKSEQSKPESERNLRVVTMRVLGAEESETGKWTILYTMLNDRYNEEHTFRVPQANLPFLDEAVETGVLTAGGGYAVTMVREGRTWYWVKIKRIA